MKLRPEIQLRLAKIKADFAAELPEKIAGLKALWSEYSGAASDPLARGNMLRICHSLAGSAKSFGFPQVSDGARQIEFILDDVAAGTMTDLLRLQIDGLLQMIDRASVMQIPDLSESGESEGTENACSPSPVAERTVAILDDDNHSSREKMLELQRFGFLARVFSAAAEFLASMRRDIPEVLILRQAMISEAVEKQVRAIMPRDRRHCKMIIEADEDSFGARMRAVRLGADKFYVRPIPRQTLVRDIEAMLAFQNPQALRVLLVDDAEQLTESYALVLGEHGFETRRISDGSRILAEIQEFRPDIIVMDLYMPEYKGTELAKLVRQFDDFIAIPIIFLSSEIDPSVQLDAKATGTQDFLTKPVEWDDFIRIVRLHAERYLQLREQMVRDSLTLLLNHRAIQDRLAFERERALKNGWPLAVAMVDIDNFKHINDTYGHAVGDAVIRGLASFLTNSLRRVDQIGRYGGEEFLVLFPNTARGAATRMMERLRLDFASIPFSGADGAFFVTFSTGVAELASVADDPLKRADSALYKAKSAGKNRVFEG